MIKSSFLISVTMSLLIGLHLVQSVGAQQTWPPILPTAKSNGFALINSADLLQVPKAIEDQLDNSPTKLLIAKTLPVIELAYHQDLPHPAFNGTGWSSWGDICLASDGKVYSGIGNHWKTEKGEAFIYCWDPSTKEFRKVVDINKLTGADFGDVRFSKVHAHIIEGSDNKIYFTGTLDNGGIAGSEEMLQKWNTKISGGKLFQFDPKTGKSVIYADFPMARVTATLKYDSERNILYAAIEGDPEGFSLGAFDMNDKKWIYQSAPGTIGNDRNFMLDSEGNIYFNGQEIETHKQLRLNSEQLTPDGKNTKDLNMLSTTMYPGAKKVKAYTTLWKYDPNKKSISPTNTYFKSEGMRSSTRESKNGFIYGTTMAGELFRYAPASDELEILGSNFLEKGEYVTVCDLSPDEKFIYYMPGAHGSASLSGTPLIQYNIEKAQQKIIAFLSEPMIRKFKYVPGGTYGLKVSEDGKTIYVNLNGSPPESIRPKGLGRGFGLTSFALIHIPDSERRD